MSPASATAPVPAVQAASVLAASPTPDTTPFEFSAEPQPVSLPLAAAEGVPVKIHCSRACDVDVALAVRREGTTTLVASYRETETEIPRAYSTIKLPLPASIASSTTSVRIVFEFVAVDASGEKKTVRRALTLRPG